MNEEIRARIEIETQKAVAKFIKDLPQTINRRMEDALAKVLGFDSQWGGEWRVDHCNGRVSLVSDYVTGKSKKLVTKALDSMITDESMEELFGKMEKVVRDSILEGAQETYRRACYDRLDSRVKAKAVADVDKLFEEMEQLNTDIEIADPNMNPLSKEILKDMVNEMGKDEKL